jgi:hypothetical protein
VNPVEWVVLAVVVVGVVFALFGWDRYRSGRKSVSNNAEPTSEVFVDPVSGKRMRVWYNPRTGQREYRPE